MNARKFLLAAALFTLTSALAAAYPVPLPSDVSVTLTATPTTNLEPGQPIAFTMTTTNHGPAPLPIFSIQGSRIYDQFYFPSSVWNDCDDLILSVADSPIVGGSYWLFTWYPIDVLVGETRTCHFSLTLAPEAAPATAFSVGLSDYWYDPDPSNDRATVTLLRAAEPVPALSPWMLLGLAGLLATLALRRRAAMGAP